MYGQLDQEAQSNLVIEISHLFKDLWYCLKSLACHHRKFQLVLNYLLLVFRHSAHLLIIQGTGLHELCVTDKTLGISCY
jgi:hypothetical protein